MRTTSNATSSPDAPVLYRSKAFLGSHSNVKQASPTVHIHSSTMYILRLSSPAGICSPGLHRQRRYKAAKRRTLTTVNARPQPEAGPEAVVADDRDRPPQFITDLFRFLYKPASGWTDRFGFAWPLGDLDEVRRAQKRDYTMCVHVVY